MESRSWGVIWCDIEANLGRAVGRRPRADPRGTDSRSGCQSAGGPHSVGMRGEQRRRSADWAEVSSAFLSSFSSANYRCARMFVTSGRPPTPSPPPRATKTRPLEGPEQGHCAVKAWVWHEELASQRNKKLQYHLPQCDADARSPAHLHIL